MNTLTDTPIVTSPPVDNGKPDGFYRHLLAATEDERQTLMGGELIGRAQGGKITLPEYRAFLAQAYHHVRHTVSLMMACGAELSAPNFVLRDNLRQRRTIERVAVLSMKRSLPACSARADAA